MIHIAESPQVDPILSSSRGRQGMGEVIFEGWFIAETEVGTGRWELRFFRSSKLWAVLSSPESDGRTSRWFYH